jgi:NDP-sugar pyrophosphorylase family protein
MNIIIPLGGKGERFKKEGYLLPKPLIKVLDKEILFHVIDNLNINDNDNVFIIYNKELDEYNFSDILTSKYPNIKLIKLEHDTKGATETLNIGISYILNNYSYYDKTIIIDGDTFYTYDIISKFRQINLFNAVYYIKNHDINPIFSYISLDEDQLIFDIQEKIKISDNANTGAYAFKSIHQLLYYSRYILDNNIYFKGECYTSCIISEMIKDKELFIGIEVNNNDVYVLGTPIQVNKFINS